MGFGFGVLSLGSVAVSRNRFAPSRNPAPQTWPQPPLLPALMIISPHVRVVEQKRRKELEIFLNRVAAHGELSASQYFKTFLQVGRSLGRSVYSSVYSSWPFPLARLPCFLFLFIVGLKRLAQVNPPAALGCLQSQLFLFVSRGARVGVEIK